MEISRAASFNCKEEDGETEGKKLDEISLLRFQ